MASPNFSQLNADWVANPDAPDVELNVDGDNVRVKFRLNSVRSDENTFGTLTFRKCSRWRWDSSDGHAWFISLNGRDLKWGHFYRVDGDGRAVTSDDWEIVGLEGANSFQFLLPCRDDTLEFVAEDWTFQRSS